MMKKGRVFFSAVMTLVILGIDSLAESKHSMGSTMKSQSSLVQLPRELKIAQKRCERDLSVSPAQETRKIREETLGFSFDIPTNYQTEKIKREALMILLYNPADIQLLECGKKNRQIGYGHQTVPVWINVEPATSESPLIPEIYQDMRLENIRETTIAGQKAFVYNKITDRGEAGTSLSANFLTPDKLNKITVSTFTYGENIGAVEEQVFNLVISSFTFVK